MAEAALDRHYDAVAASYQQAWFYEDGTSYQQWLAQQAAVSVCCACEVDEPPWHASGRFEGAARCMILAATTHPWILTLSLSINHNNAGAAEARGVQPRRRPRWR